MMDQKALENSLRETLEDIKLSSSEKAELREIAINLGAEEVRFLRNRAFDLAREQINAQPDMSVEIVLWLERVIKATDPNNRRSENSAYFSPGQECRRKIADLCHQANSNLDICVFTISDDRLTQSIVSAHKRGVNVRLITDNDKVNDLGSDVVYLSQQGIRIRTDNTAYHMHHKFMLVDQSVLVNGSFNWTRSASKNNQENILVTDDAKLVNLFLVKFDQLWQQFDHSSLYRK